MYTEPSTAHAKLCKSLGKYGEKLDQILSKVRHAEAETARDYFSSIPSIDDTLAVWKWVDVLSLWPRWRPYALQRRLTLPSPDELYRVSTSCRVAAESTDSTNRRWLQFSKPDRGVNDLLIQAADLLDAVRNPSSTITDLVDDLLPLGQSVELAMSSIPIPWTPARLTDLVVRLARDASAAPYALPPLSGPWTNALNSLIRSIECDGTHSKEWWSHWLMESGADWFHDLATLATESREAAQWLDAICSSIGVRCYPTVDSENQSLVWPKEVTMFQPGLTITVGVTPGAIVAVDRFSCVPEKARFTILLGNDPSSPLSAGLKVWQEMTDISLCHVRATLASAIDESTRAACPPSANAILAVLDEFTRVELQPTAIEPLINCIRSWAKTGGWSIIPEGAPVLGDGLSVKAVFKRDAPVGTLVRLKTFGLRGHEGLVRSGEVVISAGPPPYGLTELETVAQAAPGETGEELRSSLRGLRAAGAGGYLEFAAVDLYSLFWDRLRPTWADCDAASAEIFAEDLAAMMRETFGLRTFHPISYREYPQDWVFVPPGTRMTTGRVTRVLRPGLTSEGGLRLPALVEAE